MTRLIHTPSELREACAEARSEGKRVGLVPTMGALHAGHLSLMEEARRRADFRVTTIFVNPLQFDEAGDLDRYPRTLDDDVSKCRGLDVDLVFAPASDAMYSEGFQSHVEVEQMTTLLEGAHRSGHFRGVTTVVTKLFNLVGPSLAFFGRKDYQQWKVLHRMALDLDMPVEVVGMPIIRERDGLALSSRNIHLSADERSRALSLSKGLRSASEAWDAGERDASTLLALAKAPVEASADLLDYVELVDPESLKPLHGPVSAAVVLMAAHIGSTRLIDNMVFGTDAPPPAL